MGLKGWLKKRADDEFVNSFVNLALAYKIQAAKAKDPADKKWFMQLGIKKLTEGIEARPNYPVLYFSRANLYMAEGEYEKAKADLEMVPLNDEKVIKEASKGGVDVRKMVHENLLVTETRLGNYERAVEHFIKMRMGEDAGELLKDPELHHYALAEIHFADAESYSMHESYGKALKEYEKVLEIDPEVKSKSLRRFGTPSKDMFFFKLALIEDKTKNVEGVIKYCKKALEINPKNRYAQQVINRVGQAREEFSRKIVKTHPIKEEKILHLTLVPPITKRQDGSYDDKDFIEWIKSKTGGRTSVKPIPGREHLALQDLATGRFKKWEEYLSRNPKVLEEPPEVQVALFERDVYHEKRDIEAIRKKAIKTN